MTKNQSRAESFLKKIQEGEEILKSKQNELNALRYKASGQGAIRYDKDHVQSTPQNYLELMVDDIFKIEKQIEELKDETEKLKSKAYSIIRTFKEPDHRTLITWYYINGLTMSQTADRMNLSDRKVYYMKNDALEAFGKAMQKK